MKAEKLVSFGNIGIGLKRKDYIDLDKDFDFNFDLTDEEINNLKNKIKIGLNFFIYKIKEIIKRIEEYYQYRNKINKLIDDVKKEIKSEYLDFKVSTNIKETIELIVQYCLYQGYWAILSIEEPKLYEKASEIIFNFMSDETIPKNDDDINDINFKDFGSKARNGYSIFDRCSFHYNNIFK